MNSTCDMPTRPVEPLVPGQRPGSAKEVLLLSYPVVISMASQAVMGVVDTFFLGWTERGRQVAHLAAGLHIPWIGPVAPGGHLVGTQAQAGVGLGAVLTWTCVSFMLGTLTAVTPFVSQNRGAGDRAAAASYAWQALWLVPVLGLLAALLALVAPKLLVLVGARASIRPYGAAYMKVRLVGALPLFLSFALVAFFRGIGDTKTPMWISLGANGANVVLNYWFIFGGLGLPPLGAAGAAAATASSTAVAAAAYVGVFLLGRPARKYQVWAARALRRDRLLKLLRVGLPIGGNWLLDNVSWTFFSVLVSRIGAREMAAHTVVLQTMHLAFLPNVAMLIGTTALVGHYLGSGRPDLASRSAATSVRITLAYAFLVGFVFISSREHFVALFNRDPAVMALGGRLMVLMGVFVVLDGLYLVFTGVLRGAGDTRWAFWVSAASAWLVFMPGAYIFANVLKLGVLGAWLGLLCHGLVIAVLYWRRYASGAWKERERLAERPVPPESELGERPLPAGS